MFNFPKKREKICLIEKFKGKQENKKKAAQKRKKAQNDKVETIFPS